MTAEKTIKILNDLASPEDYYMTPEEQEAIKFGIEAVKRLEYMRGVKDNIALRFLPGETKE